MATFSEIRDAFLFVSSEQCGMHRALLCLDSGEIYYYSETGGIDEIDEEDFECEDFIEIPHKNEINLGRSLVFEFVDLYLPDESHLIEQIFSGPGAYERLKDLLRRKRLLQKWYDFEKEREEQALRAWARESEIKPDSS
jgi:hypothetical protein